MTNEILVLGATGKTGKRVLERLQKRGFAVRAGSRNGSPPFNWDKPQNLEAVLDGILRDYQVPGDIIWLMQHLFTKELDERTESLTHDIETVLGRKTGIWNIQK